MVDTAATVCLPARERILGDCFESPEALEDLEREAQEFVDETLAQARVRTFRIPSRTTGRPSRPVGSSTRAIERISVATSVSESIRPSPAIRSVPLASVSSVVNLPTPRSWSLLPHPSR